MNTFAENSIFVQSRLEKSDPGFACRRGLDLQKTLAALVLSALPLNAEGATIFAKMRDHGIIQNHCFPRNTKTSDRQNSGWNDTRIPDGC